ncbi:MAG: hypothetical protein M1305_07430 [Candidatus Marsarchaeota archaeon]|nr:hypothetical protein [Candidatus Marsarchaeota archaeon]
MCLVKPWSLQNLREQRYDIFIAAVGFEERARYVAEAKRPEASARLACAFPERKSLAYEDNLAWYLDAGFDVQEKTDKEFEPWVWGRLQDVVADKDNALSLCVDISSLSRFRIAAIVAATHKLQRNIPIVVDFVYSLAKYTPPPQRMEPMVSAAPVIEEFAGWSSSPDLPSSAIIGLGYEYDKASGVLEFVEPWKIWAFEPVGGDKRYSKAIERSNRTFWDFTPRSRVIQYRVDRPYETFLTLESLTYGISQSTRPVLIPFGPKVFTLCCLLVACVHYPGVAVWRVSSGSLDIPAARLPNRKICGLRAVFGTAEG